MGAAGKPGEIVKETGRMTTGWNKSLVLTKKVKLYVPAASPAALKVRYTVTAPDFDTYPLVEEKLNHAGIALV